MPCSTVFTSVRIAEEGGYYGSGGPEVRCWTFDSLGAEIILLLLTLDMLSPAETPTAVGTRGIALPF